MLEIYTARPDTVTLTSAIQRYFNVSLYLLVLTGFTTLASTGALDFPAVVLVGMALFLRGYFLAIKKTVLLPEGWTNVLTVIYIAFYVLDYVVLSRSFLSATVHLVLFGMVVRLFSLQRERDHYMLAVLSFLMVLAASVLTVDSTFLLAFSGFMLVAVVTFVLMEMRHSSMNADIPAREDEEPKLSRKMVTSLASAAPLLMMAILAGATIIFFVLPRVSSRYLSAYAPGNDLSSGFSDKVQLGRIGQIQQSSSVVMHVQIYGDKTGSYDLKWRGVALGLFDGRSWSNPLEQMLVARYPDGTYWLNLPKGLREAEDEEPTATAGKSLRYRVVLEPFGSNVFFLAPKAQMVTGNYRMITMDRAGAVFDLDAEHPVSSYEASSNIDQPPASTLRTLSGAVPAAVTLTYLQLPPHLDARIPQLAGQITESAANDYDRAASLERYLTTQYTYTLQLPRIVPNDPLASFLFDRKRGHCEYFASAMAVMLRTLHIPSRVVNGFRTGEFNDLTGSYVVRASNAHSWVEAYIGGYGWVSFDPTPPAPAIVHNRWDRAMLYFDAMASFWREWVINYDASHQRTLGEQAFRGGRHLQEDMRSWAQQKYLRMIAGASALQNHMRKAPGRWTLSGLLLAAVVLGMANSKRIWTAWVTRRLRSHPERAPRNASIAWYQRMTSTLARQGWRKAAAQTPKEFASGIADAALRERVVRFTAHYESARFGESAIDASKLPGLFEEIDSPTQ
jgi:transglutaminase-like putative cysteine protease